MNARLAVDIGGTFTDLVLETPQGTRSHKLLTTPDAPERAVLEGAKKLLTGETLRLVLRTAGLDGAKQRAFLRALVLRHAALCGGLDLGHHRRQGCHGPAAQIVTIGKTAGQDDQVKT